MRCPKCGYFSFDHLDTCKNCGKDISKISTELDGTVYDTLPPIFLHLDFEAPAATDAPPGQTTEAEAAESEAGEVILEEAASQENGEEDVLATEEETFLLDEEDEVAFAGDDLPAGQEETGSSEGLPIGEETGEAQEDGASEEQTLEFSALGLESELDLSPGDDDSSAEEGETVDTEEMTIPSIDFDDLDISDLGPESDEEALTREALSLEKDLGLDDEGVPPDQKESPGKKKHVQASNRLEDLQVDDLDLDTTGLAASKKKRGGDHLKTGTALDDFNVDIAELIGEKKG